MGCSAVLFSPFRTVDSTSGNATLRNQPKPPVAAWASSRCRARAHRSQPMVQLVGAPLSASGRREQSGRKKWGPTRFSSLLGAWYLQRRRPCRRPLWATLLQAFRNSVGHSLAKFSVPSQSPCRRAIFLDVCIFFSIGTGRQGRMVHHGPT